MKRIAIVTLFPEMFTALIDYGVTGRAVKQGLLEVSFSNPRDFATDRHQTVDDRPYGGGPGMVMKIEPLKAAIDDARGQLSESAKVIYLSPQGHVLNQSAVGQLATAEQYQDLILIAGRYEGIDERLLDAEVDEEWSIGDYVLSGGELPAMVLMDAIIRLLPEALGHEDSAEQDSFSQGLLDCPHYTRPDTYDGNAVPGVLLSGDHSKINRWRLQQSLGRTWLRRPELLDKIELTTEQVELLDAFKDSNSSVN
ncbi:MAG: tRNA (guanosine(37)-N1)-methyltransferase TrmD [Cellvibrionaceae bacterium]